MTYFTWDFSGEVAVGGEFETAGVLCSVVYNVNVPRLPTATDRKTGKTCVMNQITFLSFLTFLQFKHEHRKSETGFVFDS